MANNIGHSARTLIRTDNGAIVTLQLNSPETMNCLSEEMLAELDLELGRLSIDPSVKCVVLQATGRAFCAGHDLRDMLPKSSLEYYRFLFSLCSRTMQKVHRLPVPVIAKVQGDAVAAGCQLVAACDIAIASNKARFATAGINMGAYCATPAVAVQRRVPVRRAFEMLFTGKLVDAPTAAEWGLINSAVDPSKLDDAVAELAGDIASKSGPALRFGKSQFYSQVDMELSEAYQFATEGISNMLIQEDAVEGMTAFLEKRKPSYRY